MTDQMWDDKFDSLLKNYLIPVDKSFYSEHIAFTSPQDLERIFSDLEEQNLFLINQRQEIELSLEEQKNLRSKIMDTLESEAKIHRATNLELEAKILDSTQQMNQILKQKKKNSSPKHKPGYKKGGEEEEEDDQEVMNRFLDIMKKFKDRNVEDVLINVN